MEILFLNTEAHRNLVPARIDLHPRLNLIVGENGQGKTNLLEAVALVCGRPSFRTADLGIVARDGAAGFAVTARGRDAANTGGAEATYTEGLNPRAREYAREGRKIARLEARRRLPGVKLTAEDLGRLSGPPAERRRALDRAALALDPEHATHLHAYAGARAAKNRLLAMRQRFDEDELAVYEGILCRTGGRLRAGLR